MRSHRPAAASCRAWQTPPHSPSPSWMSTTHPGLSLLGRPPPLNLHPGQPLVLYPVEPATPPPPPCSSLLVKPPPLTLHPARPLFLDPVVEPSAPLPLSPPPPPHPKGRPGPLLLPLLNCKIRKSPIHGKRLTAYLFLSFFLARQAGQTASRGSVLSASHVAACLASFPKSFEKCLWTLPTGPSFLC